MRFRALREAGTIVAAAVALFTVVASVPALASTATTAHEAVSHVRLNHMVYGHNALGQDTATVTVPLGAVGLVPAGTDSATPGTNRMNIADIRAKYIGWKLNSSVASGWGEATMEHFPYLGSSRYGVTITYGYNNKSTLTAETPATPDATTGWDCVLHPLTAGHCWNIPQSWDWGGIWHQLAAQGDYAYDNLKACERSLTTTAAWSIGGAYAGRYLINTAGDTSFLVKLNPDSFIFGLIGKCVWSFSKTATVVHLK